jgi:hypothetical protein
MSLGYKLLATISGTVLSKLTWTQLASDTTYNKHYNLLQLFAYGTLETYRGEFLSLPSEPELLLMNCSSARCLHRAYTSATAQA